MAFSGGYHGGAAYQTGFFMNGIFVHDRSARRRPFFPGSDMSTFNQHSCKTSNKMEGG